MFRMLRAALRSGNLREILRLSREASALQNLNRAGGIPTSPTQPSAGRFQNDAFMSDPDFAFNQRYTDPSAGATEFYGRLPDGRNMTMNPQTGARSTFANPMYPSAPSPTQAPYEGFRVWSESYGGAPVAYSPDSIPPWMGRGTPPSASQVRFPEGRVFTPRQTEPFFNDLSWDSWMSRPKIRYSDPDFQYNLNNYNSF
jgi:hypothetical protein